MKFQLPLLVALFGSLLLMPSAHAEGEMRSPLGMDEEFQRRLAPAEAPPSVEAQARPQFPGRETVDSYTAMNNAEYEAVQAQEDSHRVRPPYMEQRYETTTNAWQDKVYYQAQEKAPVIPGILRAPEQKIYSRDHKVMGTATCYKGNTAQWLKGTSAPLGKTLPTTQTGLLALSGQAGAAGAFAGTASRGYSLPQTATALDVELNVAQ